MWFYDTQLKTALSAKLTDRLEMLKLKEITEVSETPSRPSSTRTVPRCGWQPNNSFEVKIQEKYKMIALLTNNLKPIEY